MLPYLNAVGQYPWPGTPAWTQLADDDRHKWAGLLDFAQHHALRVEVAQTAHAQASRAVAGAADWSVISREIRSRNDLFTARPWLRRTGHNTPHTSDPTPKGLTA